MYACYVLRKSFSGFVWRFWDHDVERAFFDSRFTIEIEHNYRHRPFTRSGLPPVVIGLCPELYIFLVILCYVYYECFLIGQFCFIRFDSFLPYIVLSCAWSSASNSLTVYAGLMWMQFWMFPGLMQFCFVLFLDLPHPVSYGFS